MKYLLKLDEHLNSVKELDLVIIDIDGNKLYISNTPDYILEIRDCFYYLYPKYFELHKEHFTVVICNYCNMKDILKEILDEENVEILSMTKYKTQRKRKRKLVMNG